MKKNITLKNLFLALGLLGTCWLNATQNEIGNQFYTLKLKQNKIYVHVPKQVEPIAVIEPNFHQENASGLIVKYDKDKAYRAWVLRNSKSSITLEVANKAPYFTLCLNRNASPVKVNWQSEATVLPDVFGEDLLLLPGKNSYKIPPFINGFMGLLKNGSATIGCIPIRATQNAVLSGDQQTLTLNQRNTEDYRFVINSGEKVWHKTVMPAKPGDSKIISDWKVPYSAGWQAAYRFERGFVPEDDGLFNNWGIAEKKEKKFVNNSPFSSFQNAEKRWAWHGGYEAMFTYPVEVNNGTVTLRHPTFTSRIERLKYDVKTPVYFYAWHRGASGTTPMPADFMPPWTKDIRIYKTINIGLTPTTCSMTRGPYGFEQLYYNDKALEKIEFMKNNLSRMQCFVESIRGRLENGLVWSRTLRRKLQKIEKRQPELKPQCVELYKYFDAMELIYKNNRARISSPEQVLKLSKQVVDLATSKLDSEKQEEKAKLLGRKIRFIGGGQDNVIGYFRHYGKLIRVYSLTQYMLSKNEDEEDFWTYVYTATENMLQGRYGHDGK